MNKHGSTNLALHDLCRSIHGKARVVTALCDGETAAEAPYLAQPVHDPDARPMLESDVGLPKRATTKQGQLGGSAD